jgi:hypothetical protein
MQSLIGNVQVVTSEGGHQPEFWARRASERILQISDSAPQPIRDQAYAFRNQMEAVILHYMKEAIKSSGGIHGLHR